MATENGAVELEIQSPSTGAKLGQEMEGGAWERVFEFRVGLVPLWEFYAQVLFVWSMGDAEIRFIYG